MLHFTTDGALSQGVVSVILVMPQFLGRFPEVSATASGGGFYKGLMTGMIELGALIGGFLHNLQYVKY